MSPGWRISPALLAAIAAAALSFGVSFAVVADATKPSEPDRVAARPVTQATPAHLALTRAPSLRVRDDVLPPPAPPVQAASEPATPAPPAPTEQTTTEQTPAPQTQTETQAPTTSTPAPTPTPKPVVKPKPKPSKPKPTGPDFDDSGPQGP